MTEHSAERRPRRRLFTASAVVVVLLAAGTTAWWFHDGRYRMARSAWEPASEQLLTSMRSEPVPGWHLTAADLGVPAPGRIVVDSLPTAPKPLIGKLGDRLFLLATDEAASQWWITGVDVRTGGPLFPAMKLAERTRPDCFVNAPSHVLCLQHRADGGYSAAVVDANAGAPSYTGPTDLRILSNTLAVKQVGQYAIAHSDDVGVYGIGPGAETTWFVPGAGDASIPARTGSATPQLTLAVQGPADPRAVGVTVFDPADGRVVEPELPDGATLSRVEVYPGGFAGSVTSGGVGFFDDTGRLLAESSSGGVLADYSPGLPVLVDDGTATVYSPAGDPLLEVPDGRAAGAVVGTTLFVNEATGAPVGTWRQYDLKTGAEGPACEFDLTDYLGTDGEVLVFEVSNRRADAIARAFDPQSCAELWTLPRQPDSVARIWRVGSTLVRLSDNGTELVSLVGS